MEIPKVASNRRELYIKSPAYRVTSLLSEKSEYYSFRRRFLYRRPSLEGRVPKSILRIRSSISINSQSREWLLRTDSGRRSTIVNYLFHKWLFASLSKKEKLLLYDLKESTFDPMIYSALKASYLVSKKTIQKALILTSHLLFGRKPPTFERWIGYRTFRLEIETQRGHPTKRGKRYSGWRRHQNDKGSLAPHNEDPFYITSFDENDNITTFLRICNEINSGRPEIYINNLRIKV